MLLVLLIINNLLKGWSFQCCTNIYRSTDIKKPQLISRSAIIFFPKVLHLVNYFIEQFFVWNKSWLSTTDKSYCSRWYDSYQGFQCDMMLLAWINGTFNIEEGLGQNSTVQSIMHHITEYINFRVSGIVLCN